MSLWADGITDIQHDISQGRPWLPTFVARWWFTPSQPDREWHGRRPRRVRALIGRRMTKQARDTGAHGAYELPHASDDARLDLSSHRQALRLSSEGAAYRSRPFRAVQLRPQLNSGSRFRTERTFPACLCREPQSRGECWARVASSTPDAVAHGPTTCPPRSGGRSPTAWLIGAAESCEHRFGAGRLGEDSRDCPRSPCP